MAVAFLAGSTDGDMQCLTVSIVDNTVMNGAMTFTVTLITADPDVMLGNNMTTVIITDNEGTPVATYSSP